MTLEAAFTLSLLIFASVSLMLPAKIMITERKMQAGLESAGEELSQFAYLLDSLNEEKSGKIVQVPENQIRPSVSRRSRRRSSFMPVQKCVLLRYRTDITYQYAEIFSAEGG